MPIINELIGNGNSVILGITSGTKDILISEFPQLRTVDLPEYNIKYSNWLPLWFKLCMDLPRIWNVMRKEHALADVLVKQHGIDLLISDNRYGLFSKNARSVVICHQLNLKTPFMSKIINKVHVYLLNRFNEVWVPDYKDRSRSLAGELSENVHELNCRYIGPLSRLSYDGQCESVDDLFILSGPEPLQHHLFLRCLKVCKKANGKKCLIVTSKAYTVNESDRAIVLFQPDKAKLQQLICGAKRVICRSGYSTLMDLHILGKKEIVCIPTPGQTEQEYLAAYWKRNYNALILREDQLETLTT